VRLCLVSREYPPLTEYSGGIGRQFAALARELARQGHEVHVATITPARGRYELHEGVHVHLLRESALPGPLAESRSMIRRAINVDRLLRAAGPWHVVYAAEWRGEAAGHALRRHRTAVVTNLASSLATVHQTTRADETSAAAGLSSRARSAIQHAIERFQTERSNAIVAPSNAILDWAKRAWRVERIPARILPNMIDVERTRRLSAGRPPDGFPPDEPPVVYFGRLEEVKGVDVLVGAMRRLWAGGRTTRLVLIGHDTRWGARERMSARLERVAAPHSDRITFIEAQPPDRLFPAVAASAMVVLPSRWESFSLAALETMALGRPLIASRVGGLSEFLRDGANALLVAPGDEAALATAIERLLDDPALRDHLASQAARDAPAFDVAPVAREHAGYFEQIAAASAS
jgi:glycogen(starch) synthase